MKSCLTRAFAIVSLVAVSATAPLAGQQPAPATAPAQAARPAPIKSPELHSDRTVTFRLLAPKPCLRQIVEVHEPVRQTEPPERANHLSVCRSRVAS